MRKLLLSLSLVFFTALTAYAQCTPDPTITSLVVPPPGSKIDTINGNEIVTLPYGYVGQYYQEILYFKIPVDTQAYGQTVAINFLQIDSILNLPPGFSTSCNPIGCKIYGGSPGCLSTSGVPYAVDSVELKIAVTLNVTLYGLPKTYSDTLGNYYLVTKNGGHTVGINEMSLDKKSPKIYPNPTSSQLHIDYKTQVTGPAEITLTNMLGRVVAHKSTEVHNGNNTVTFDVQSLTPGVYMYTVYDSQKTFTGRFIISR